MNHIMLSCHLVFYYMVISFSFELFYKCDSTMNMSYDVTYSWMDPDLLLKAWLWLRQPKL
jgi:hypothetical protein